MISALVLILAGCLSISTAIPQIPPCLDVIAVNCPSYCKMVLDENGCKTCQCPDDCRKSGCLSKYDECVFQSSGYVCLPIKPIKLCCPKPVKPINYAQNFCLNCQTTCKDIICKKGLMCCPDWSGCKQCLKPIPCWFIEAPFDTKQAELQ